MKTNKIQLNKKALIKATSGILSFVLTANTGLSLLYENVYAREIEYDSNRDIYTLSSSTGDAEMFYLMKDDDSYFISDSLENPNHEKDIGASSNFTINENCTLVVLTDYSIEKLTLNGGDDEGTEAVLIISEDVSLNHRIVTGTGLNKIINYGEYTGDGFNPSVLESDGIKSFHNEGLISGRGASLNGNIYTDAPGASISVHDNFVKDDRDTNTTIEVLSTTTITSTGGTFKLKVGDDLIEITEPVDGAAANTLVDDPEITLDEVPDFYVGKTIDFSTYIHTADGYSGTPYVEFSYNGEIWSVKSPTSSGDYYIRAVAPGSGTYPESFSDRQSVRIDYLPISDVIKEGSYCTLSGIANGKYISGELIITPPEGYTITCSHDTDSYNEDGPVFLESLSLSKSEIVTDAGSINQDVMVSFKSTKNNIGATTDTKSIYEVLPKDSNGDTVWDSLVFDTEDPYFTAYIYDEEEEICDVSLEEEDHIVFADDLYIVEIDDNLKSVTAVVDGVETDYSSEIVAPVFGGNGLEQALTADYLMCEIELQSTPGKAKQVKITATDAADRVSTVEFTLMPEITIDPELEVTLPETIYVGDEYEPDIETNSDSEEIVFEYYDLDNDTELEEAPTAAGSYKLTVTLGPTDLFNEASFELDFEILKNDFEASVSVANIYVEGTVNPVLSGVPEDYTGTATYKYKLSTDEDSEYSATVPSDAGTYTVLATIPATDEYEGTTCTDEFTISKYEVTATVSVADLNVGGTITPVLTVDPEGYNGDIEYEYKLSVAPNTAYSTTVPSAAGEYTVRATLSGNYKYLGTTCTDTFTISKNDVTATVTVADILVDGTVKPELTIDPEDYDDMEHISYEYKLSTDEDSGYSFTVPSAAGTYTLRVTLPATDTYLGTTCFTEFTISKNTVTAKVTVDDTYYGEDYEPVVETVSKGEVTFYYRDNSKGDDSPYLEGKPTVPGNYTVVAEIEATDKCNELTCSTTFNILKAVPVITFDIPDEIYAGEDYVIGVETNSDAEVFKRFYYNDGGMRDAVFETEPKSMGEYIVTVTLQETDLYEGATESKEFTVEGKTFTPGVTVADCYAGETPVPVLTGVPEDYTGTIVYETRINGDVESEFAEGLPTVTGNYTLRVTFQSTNIYYGTTCTADFSITKRSVQATVSVADIYVDGTVTPVLTLIDPEEYENIDDTIYQYKLSAAPDSEYSTTVPSAAGEYTVRALIPPSDVYNGGSCTDTFTISKYATEAFVTVDDITYGDTVSPVLTVDPESYDNTENISFEYRLSTDPEAEYSFDVPTDAGTYSLLVTVPATNKYEGTTCEAEFTIEKLQITASVSVENITYGDEISPVVTTDPEEYDGKVEDYIFEYKLSTDEDTEYSETVPENAGTYTVRVSLPDTDNYIGTTCEDTFTISKTEVTATVSAADIYVGDTPDPKVTSVSKGQVTFEYKLSTDPDTAYSETVPEAAGEYKVRATVAETANYLSTTCEDTFTISKNAVTATVSVADIYVDETPSPEVTTVSRGQVTFEYKLSTDSDEEYSETVPTTAGEYTVRATVKETAEYLSTTCEDTFEILKYEVTAEVTVENILVGGDVDPKITIDPEEYNGEVTVEYIADGDTEYTTEAPEDAGSYTVRVTLSETEKYLGTTCEDTFTIGKNAVTATVSVADIYVGETPDPKVTTASRGQVTIEYKLSTDEDSAYSETVPTAAGEYKVRATVEETAEYLSTTCEDTFEILKYEVTAEVSVANILVGGDVAPEITIDPEEYDGDVTVEYAIDGDTKYSTEVPEDAGSYTVRVTLSETDNYLGTTCENTFTISKNEVTATVTVKDIYVDEKPAPVVTTASKGQVTIEYKLSTAPDTAYSETVPTAAGVYKVRATIAESNEYLSTTCEATFEILKYEVTAQVTAADIFVGGNVAPDITIDPEEYDGDVTVEYAIEGGTKYSTEVPEAAGSYTVKVTLSETDTYLGTTCEDTFTISKNAVMATVSVADIHIGETPDPKVTTVSRGQVTFEYKLSSDSDTEYTGTVPSAAGEYTVRATVAETAEYLSTTCEATFRILKNPVTATVSVADIYVGETPDPKVTTVSRGQVTFEYKLSSDPDSEYSGTVPATEGEYTVRATVAETDEYLSTTCKATFRISKRTASAAVSVEDITVGGTVKPVVSVVSDGRVIVEYKLSTDPDKEYSETVPSVAGVYTVRVTVEETENYTGAVSTNTFTISKNVTTASVAVADIYVGGEVTPVVTTISNGKAGATFEYKLSSADDSTYSSTVPSAAGTYTVRATIPATVEYARIVCTAEFKIKLNPVTKLVLTVPDIYYGQTVKPEYETDSNGDVTIMYKLSDSDGGYSQTPPVAVGKYTAIAITAETARYESASVTTEFSISYLEKPQTAYVPSGTAGDNGYYTSDVDLKAPDGYLISATPDGEFKESIPYTEDISEIYLKRIEDNALTAAITLADKPKIDKIAPVFNGSAGGVLEDAVLFEESLVVVVDDKNLASLTVNGDVIDLNAGGANILTLTRPEDGYMSYHIVAIDVAGNVSTLDISLLADWLKERIIPAGRALPLTKGEMYFLDVGEWIVTIVNSDGTETESKTVFNGNMPFYVSSDAQYIFKKVT